MKNLQSFKEILSNLLRVNKLAIFVEIILVFLPLYLGLAVSDLLGIDHIQLGSNIEIIGGPFSYLGLMISLLAFWGAATLRGVSWNDFSLTRPKSWFRTILISLGVAFAVLGTVVLIINPIMKAFPNLPPQDLSRFDYLSGSLPNLIIQLVIVWITAAFLEEFLFRGYLMNRIVDLYNKETNSSWVVALVGQAVIFGLVHSQQGIGGIFKVGVIGLIFGISYLVTGRNLWPLILAHGLIDTLDMVSHYLGN